MPLYLWFAKKYRLGCSYLKSILAFVLNAAIKVWHTISQIALKVWHVICQTTQIVFCSIPNLLLAKINTAFLRFYLSRKRNHFHSRLSSAVRKNYLSFIRSHYSLAGCIFIVIRILALALCIFVLLTSADYLLNRLFNSNWEQYISSGKFYVTSIVNEAWVADILKTLDYSALGNVAMSIGVTGALFSWLLQIIKDEECGVEMSSLFHRFYPGYIANLWAFIASTAICIYCCDNVGDASSSRMELRFIILSNLISMVFELLYMALMCRKFLFNFHTRKDAAHVHLLTEINNTWNNRYGSWYLPELSSLFGDFSYIVTKQKKQNWLRSTKRYATPNHISDVIVNWITHVSRSTSGKANTPMEADTFRACNEMIGFLQKSVVDEMVGYLHGCFMIAESCIHEENEIAKKNTQKVLAIKNRLHHWTDTQLTRLSAQGASVPKWLLVSIQKTEGVFSVVTDGWNAYFKETEEYIQNRESIAGILVSLYLKQYIKKRCANTTNESILNFCDEVNIAISFLKAQDLYNSEFPTRFALRFASLLLCLNTAKGLQLKSMLISIKQCTWSSFFVDTSSVAEDCFIQSRGTLNMFDRIPYNAATAHQSAEDIYRQVFIA